MKQLRKSIRVIALVLALMVLLPIGYGGYSLNPNTSAVEQIKDSYELPAMSAYYVTLLDVIIDCWSLDGTTGIGTITTTTPEGDIYTIGGQKVGSGEKAAKRLQHGVYVVGGKKHAK